MLVPREVSLEVGEVPGFVTVRRVQNVALTRALCQEMDLGEAAAIALAVETEGAAIVLDDRKGRRGASRMGLAVVGSIAFVLAAKRDGHPIQCGHCGALERAVCLSRRS